MYQRFITWLNTTLFPRIVAYATHPIVILCTMLLLVPLIVFASVTWLALILGNYTNVVSAAVSSIVLATSMQHHHEQRKHIQALHAKIDAMTAQSAPPPAQEEAS